MKLLYLSNIPSPYRVNFFNELGKYCDLTVLFETDASTERDASWKSYRFSNFKGVILPGIRTGMDTAFCPSVLRYLRRNQYDHIILTVLASPTGLLASAWLKLLHIPYCYEGDGGVVKKKRGPKAALKTFIISSAKLCFSTSVEFDHYCIAYGSSIGKIRRYPFSSVYEKDILEEVPSRSRKTMLREALNITEDHFILSVGRIVPIKGYDILLKTFSHICDPSWGIYIIGGKITPEYQQIVTELNLKNIHFIEFMLPEELVKYYMAADIFVLPTRYDPWGLVINEAMSAGLPVVTTYACGAGTEMVMQEENGYLYEPEDISALETHLRKLMGSEELRTQYGTVSLQIAANYTIEKMTETHCHVLAEDTGNGGTNRK